MSPILWKHQHLFALPALLLAGCATLSGSGAETLLIRNVTVVDPAQPARYPNAQDVRIANGRIQEITGASSRPSSATRVLDGTGKYLIPGLWDTHVHFMNTGPTALSLYIANGVTSVREMGGYIDSTRRWQARMRTGDLVGPRIMTPGPILENPAYLARVLMRDSALGGRLAPRILPYRVGITDSARARAVIDSLQALNVDFVKFRTVSSRANLLAILREAKRAGLKVAGHEAFGISVADAADAGQDDIEHLFVLPTDSAVRHTIASMAGNGTWFTPTLAVSRMVQVSRDSARQILWGRDSSTFTGRQYAASWLLEWWRMQVDERENPPDSVRGNIWKQYQGALAILRGLVAAGVPILAGTDAGSVLTYPGFALHEELRLFVEDAKLTPAQALYFATVAPARFFDMERDLGALAEGRIADLVLLDGNPLADINNTKRINAVIQNGRVMDRAYLDDLLLQVRRTVAGQQ